MEEETCGRHIWEIVVHVGRWGVSRGQGFHWGVGQWDDKRNVEDKDDPKKTTGAKMVKRESGDDWRSSVEGQ